MILIYQMGKVASRSWYEAIRAAAPEAEPPAHFHHLAEPCRQRLAAILDLPAPWQTIANRIMPREQLRKGAELQLRIADCRRRGETLRIVTGVREPVARSLSLLMFMADFYGHVSRPLAARQGADAGTVAGALAEYWTSVFGGEAPRHSFEWVARNAIGMFRSWFAEELQAVFGIDVLSAPFPADGVQRLSAPGIEVLVYRVEDMGRRAPARAALLAAGSDMLGLPLRDFPDSNTAATRRSYPLYAAVREQFSLPATLLDAIYAEASVRHFYSAEERSGFQARWRAGTPGASR